MPDQATRTADERPPIEPSQWRDAAHAITLTAALSKRAAGVPTYTVPEAAALLSVSREHLYRLVRAGEFPAVHVRLARKQGRYIVPAKAVEAMLDAATCAGALIDAADYVSRRGVS